MNIRNTYSLVIALLAINAAHADLNTAILPQTEQQTTLKEVVVSPYNKETDTQKLRPFITTWMKRNGKSANEEELNRDVDYELNHRIGQYPDQNIVADTYLVSQGQTICGLITTHDHQAGIVYFDSMIDAKNACPIVAKIIETFKQDPKITKISWVDFNGIDTEKKQRDIASLTQHGFSQGESITIPYTSITLDSYELNLENK